MKLHCYEICVEEHLSDAWAGCFDGLALRRRENSQTAMTGLLDQAALHGVLAQIGRLNLSLVHVIRVQSRPDDLS